MTTHSRNYTASNPAPVAESSTSRASSTMPSDLHLEDLQDFQPPRTYIAEQVYNVSDPVFPDLDFAPPRPQPQSLPPPTATGSPNANVVSLFESHALTHGLGDRSSMAGPSMDRWWYCCRDRNLNNPDLCAGRCTTCGHTKCPSCEDC